MQIDYLSVADCEMLTTPFHFLSPSGTYFSASLEVSLGHKSTILFCIAKEKWKEYTFSRQEDLGVSPALPLRNLVELFTLFFKHFLYTLYHLTWKWDRLPSYSPFLLSEYFPFFLPKILDLWFTLHHIIILLSVLAFWTPQDHSTSFLEDMSTRVALRLSNTTAIFILGDFDTYIDHLPDTLKRHFWTLLVTLCLTVYVHPSHLWSQPTFQSLEKQMIC